MDGTSESSGQTLTAGVSTLWSTDGKRPDGASSWLDRSVAPGQDSLSLLVFRAAEPFANLPHEKTIALRAFPALDEIWALFLLVHKARAREVSEFPATWEAMCRYAGDVRQGLWPDRVAPEHAVQAVYLAIAQHHLLNDPPKRDEFIHETLAFCAIIGDKLAAGARLYDDDLVRGEARLERYVALLARDRLLYQEDLGRAKKFFAELGGEMTPAGVTRSLPLLAITRPIATQFKMWARTDTAAPGGRGYPLLLIAQDKTMIVLSADPASRAKVGILAKTLSEREKEKRAGKESPWYDGKDHGGTLVAAPREGTALSLDEVIDGLKKGLRLRPIHAGGGRGKTVTIATAAAILAGVAIVGLTLHKTEPSKVVINNQASIESVDEGEGLVAANGDKPRGSKGDPLSPSEVINLIDKTDGPRSIVPYALITGVCGYEGEHMLHAPCRDARAMRDLLIQKYGYKRENIIYLVDKPEAGDTSDGHPTAEGLKLAVEKFRSKFGDKDESSFLFYYSGHGGYIKGARQDFGVLQPSEFFDKRAALPNSHKGWDMQDLLSDIRKGVPSRHVMLLLDCCYSGWAVGAKGDDELDAHVGSLWKERAEVVLTAASKGQRAWEDDPEERAWAWGGHSVMTSFILEGLTVGAAGTASADSNTDHVVTDEELARFVKERVPESVRAQKNTKQTPTLFRFDASLPKSGRFLFVPRSEP